MFKCICGKEFKSIQAFNGHKSHCILNAQAAGKSIDKLKAEEAQRAKGKKDSERIKQKNLRKNQLKEEAEQAELQQWLSTEPKCEKCGKVMTEKYASGRFCCKSCANGRPHSKESKLKTSKALKGRKPNRQKIIRYITVDKKKEEYNKNPNKCQICDNPLPYERKNRKTCCKECYLKLASKNSSELAKKYGGNINTYGTRGRAKYGTYQGIHCDSSWELAYVIYCLENNIKIERNKKGFKYIFNGEESTYYPDFFVNNTFIEIKNYKTDRVVAKIRSLPKNITYKILYRKDMKKYIEYCINKYGQNYSEKYDRKYPSYMDKK